MRKLFDGFAIQLQSSAPFCLEIPLDYPYLRRTFPNPFRIFSPLIPFLRRGPLQGGVGLILARELYSSCQESNQKILTLRRQSDFAFLSITDFCFRRNFNFVFANENAVFHLVICMSENFLFERRNQICYPLNSTKMGRRTETTKFFLAFKSTTY
jgi:hypothetical protein